MKNPTSSELRHILFLDGDCVFCQKSAVLLHRIDQRERLYFAPLQGETAKALPASWRQLKDEKERATGAAVLAEAWATDQQIHWRGADAILRAIYLAGGIGVILWPLYWLPHRIKSSAYRFIARHRHLLSSSKATCMIPDDHFKQFLLP